MYMYLQQQNPLQLLSKYELSLISSRAKAQRRKDLKRKNFASWRLGAKI